MVDPTTRRVVVTRDAVFDEEKWEQNKNPTLDTRSDGDMFVLHYVPLLDASEMAQHKDQIGERDSDTKPYGLNSPHTPAATLDGLVFERNSLQGPRDERDIKNLNNETFPIELMYSRFCLLGEQESKFFEKAKVELTWRKAREEELSFIHKNRPKSLFHCPTTTNQ